MEATLRKRTTHPISHYWGMLKGLDDGQKLELVSLILCSVKSGTRIASEQEKENGFRSLAGCWQNDSGDDDMEDIIRRGRESRRGNRFVPAFDE